MLFLQGDLNSRTVLQGRCFDLLLEARGPLETFLAYVGYVQGGK